MGTDATIAGRTMHLETGNATIVGIAIETIGEMTAGIDARTDVRTDEIGTAEMPGIALAIAATAIIEAADLTLTGQSESAVAILALGAEISTVLQASLIPNHSRRTQIPNAIKLGRPTLYNLSNKRRRLS